MRRAYRATLPVKHTPRSPTHPSHDATPCIVRWMLCRDRWGRGESSELFRPRYTPRLPVPRPYSNRRRSCQTPVKPPCHERGKPPTCNISPGCLSPKQPPTRATTSALPPGGGFGFYYLTRTHVPVLRSCTLRRHRSCQNPAWSSPITALRDPTCIFTLPSFTE